MGPHAVYSRFFGTVNDLYVSPGADFVIEGPVENASLVQKDCMDLCILTPDCNSIAFPGCHLMNWRGATYGFHRQDQHGIEGDDAEYDYYDAGLRSLTAVYLKQEITGIVNGLAGVPYA